MTTIVGTLPTTIKNGDLEDATVLMSLFTFIQAQINANGAANGANADITSMTACTAISPLASINGGPLAGLKNRLHNPNFQVNQLGVSGTVTLSAGQYGHDRWKAGAGGCTYTYTVVGRDTVITITAGSLMQVVEAPDVEGGVYTLSNKGTAQARAAINGAATSGAYATGPITTASATGGQTMTVEFTTGTVDRPQLEPGTVASAFERRPYALDFLLCARHMQILSVNAYSSGFIQDYTTATPMRTAAFSITVQTSTWTGTPNFTATSFNTFRQAAFVSVSGGGTILLSANL